MATSEDAEAALGIVRVKLKKSRSHVRIKSVPGAVNLRLEDRTGAVIEAQTPYPAWLPFEWYRTQAWIEGRPVATKEFQVMLAGCTGEMIITDNNCSPGTLTSPVGSSGPFTAFKAEPGGGWLCRPDYIGGGDGCDCGCGGSDSDCNGVGRSTSDCRSDACEICYDDQVATACD